MPVIEWEVHAIQLVGAHRLRNHREIAYFSRSSKDNCRSFAVRSVGHH